MHTFHLKDFIDGHHLSELLEKLHIKTLKEVFQRNFFSDDLVLLVLFFMVFYIIKLCLMIMRNFTMFP